MKPLHLMLAILVPAIWGLNFIFIKLALHDVPPILLTALRFLFSAFPAVLFIKKPKIPWDLLLGYGLFMFGLQFSLLFMGLQAGIAPGLASLIAQLQIFFSMILAAVFLKEKPSIWQIMGACIAFLGMGYAWMHLTDTGSTLGFILVVAASLSWGMGNIFVKLINPKTNMMALVIWGSLVACPPLMILSYALEGYDTIISSITHCSWLTWVSLCYIVYFSTWIGYSAWSWLLRTYCVTTIVPFTLLVPLFGMLGAYLVFSESIQSWKIISALLVLLGLCIHLFGSHLFLQYSEKKWMQS